MIGSRHHQRSVCLKPNVYISIVRSLVIHRKTILWHGILLSQHINFIPEVRDFLRFNITVIFGPCMIKPAYSQNFRIILFATDIILAAVDVCLPLHGCFSALGWFNRHIHRVPGVLQIHYQPQWMLVCPCMVLFSAFGWFNQHIHRVPGQDLWTWLAGQHLQLHVFLTGTDL